MNIKIKHQCEDSLKFPSACYSSFCNMKSCALHNFMIIKSYFLVRCNVCAASGERTSRFRSPTCLSSHPSIRKTGRVPGLSMKILKIPRGLLEVVNGKKDRQYNNGRKKRKQRQNMVHKTPHSKLKID